MLLNSNDFSVVECLIRYDLSLIWFGYLIYMLIWYVNLMGFFLNVKNLFILF